MKKIALKWIAILGLVSVMAGCASGVKRLDSSDAATLRSSKVTQVQISLTEEAKKLVADNTNFSVTNLKASIDDQLKALDLIKPNADQVMEITVKSFRARSAFTAIAFGFMAGNDNIVGIMTVKDNTGKVLKSAEINASYALGGIAGGGTETRMGWLYGEFAKLAIQELTVAVK